MKDKKTTKTDPHNTQNIFVNYIILEDDNKTEINKIYHISDIHIRNIQRHNEYNKIFNKVYNLLNNLITSKNKHESLIVITGDIMHAKTELSPEAINIAYHFFKELSNIATVIMIPGNHDCNLSNRNRLDALSPIVEDIGQLDKLYYLKNSGAYQYYNIVFGVTSIFDYIITKAESINPKKWKNILQKKKYKIALFHGPVHGAKTDVGYRMNTDQFLAEDFDGYDFVMLGDIHKYQYVNDAKTIAYAGSLIQQSYGENLYNHGILMWDLLNNTSKLLKIKNDYGFCTIKIVNGEIEDTNLTIPKKPRIRFILENTNQIQYQDILADLENKYQIHEIIKETNFKTQKNIMTYKNKIKNITALESQISIIKDYLEKKNTDKDIITKIIELHKKFYQKNLSTIKDQVANITHNASNNQTWKILELNFSNMLSYGKDNCINFRLFKPNNIIGIMAPNHYGKSSILDIILFCLFDKFSRGDKKDILNKNKNKMYCSILFSIGSQKYLIERSGIRDKNGISVKTTVNFFLIENETKKNLNGSTINNTNKKISELIGNYDDYLTTCFCLQQNKLNNFIDMTQMQKKEFLNEMLKLNVFENCCIMAKKKIKKTMIHAKILEKQISTFTLEETKSKINKINTDITYIKKKFFIYDSVSEYANYRIKNNSNKILIKYNDLSEYNLKTENDIIIALDNVQKSLETINVEKCKEEIKKNKEQCNLLKNKLLELDCSEQTNYIAKIQILNEKKTELLKKIIYIPDKNKYMTHDEYMSKLNSLKNKINDIDCLLLKYKNIESSSNHEKIADIKLLLNELHRSIKPLNGTGKRINEIHNKISKIRESHYDLNKIINYISSNEIQKLHHQIEIKNNICSRIEKNIEKLNQYQYNINEVNDHIINEIVKDNNEWLEEYKKWIEEKTTLISINVENTDNYKILKKLNKQLIISSCDYLAEKDNEFINNKILFLENLLESDYKIKEYNILAKKKKILQEKIFFLESSMEELVKIEKQSKDNEKIYEEIKLIDSKLEKVQIKNEIINSNSNELKQKLSQYDKMLISHEELLKKYDKLNIHKNMLRNYYIQYISWMIHTYTYNTWINIKTINDNDILMSTKEINEKEQTLIILKKEISDYLKIRQEYDDLISEINIYQLYVNMMNYNGIPYDILKMYVPIIETDVNQILHAIVNFNVEFMIYDEEHIKKQKNDQCKLNIGCINLNLCYPNMMPYNVQLSSGFERFVISLAIRIVLCQMSLTSKPNFLIIDEGWSCLDSDNLNNINKIMDYIKNHHEHTIIISHIEELKSQAEYVINIEKRKGYSYIKL